MHGFPSIESLCSSRTASGRASPAERGKKWWTEMEHSSLYHIIEGGILGKLYSRAGKGDNYHSLWSKMVCCGNSRNQAGTFIRAITFEIIKLAYMEYYRRIWDHKLQNTRRTPVNTSQLANGASLSWGFNESGYNISGASFIIINGVYIAPYS